MSGKFILGTLLGAGFYFTGALVYKQIHKQANDIKKGEDKLRLIIKTEHNNLIYTLDNINTDLNNINTHLDNINTDLNNINTNLESAHKNFQSHKE